MEEAFKQGLRALVEENVLEINALFDKFELGEEDKKRAEALFEENMRRYGNLANYKHLLESYGLTVEYIKDMLSKSLLRQKYVESKLSLESFVSPEEARRYYDDNKSSFLRKETVTLRQIAIKFGQGQRSRRQALALVNKIRADIENGEDFGALAKQFSEGPMREEGGLWEPVVPSELVDEIARAIEHLKEGEISETVEREGQFIIIKLEKRDSSPYEPFASALNKIETEINNLRRQEKFPEFMKEMYSRVKIEILVEGIALSEICPLCPGSRADGSGEDSSGGSPP